MAIDSSMNFPPRKERQSFNLLRSNTSSYTKLELRSLFHELGGKVAWVERGGDKDFSLKGQQVRSCHVSQDAIRTLGRCFWNSELGPSLSAVTTNLG